MDHKHSIFLEQRMSMGTKQKPPPILFHYPWYVFDCPGIKPNHPDSYLIHISFDVTVKLYKEFIEFEKTPLTGIFYLVFSQNEIPSTILICLFRFKLKKKS